MRPRQSLAVALTCLALSPLSARADCPVPSTPLRADVRGAACPGDGFWGDWTAWQFCPPGTYVHMYQMRVERPQGSGDIGDHHDDTALNAVELQCMTPEGSPASRTLMPHPGWWGDWDGWAACPGPGERMVAAKLLLEGKQGGDSDQDDTAANAVKFLCQGGAEREAPHATNWGKWSADWARCPAGQAICGVQVRIEAQQGGGDDHDDTAMNGVRFACCTVGCCKLCRTGKACGDTCISATETCHQPRGCACQVGCPSGTTDCGGQCVDTKTNAQHCGQCTNVCPSGQVCQGGTCQCPANQTNCNGACTDLLHDPAHCGNCIRQCAPGQACHEGVCL